MSKKHNPRAAGNMKRSFSRSNNNKQHRFYKKPQRLHVTVEPGQVALRLLCPTPITGGLIGPSGTIIQRIEQMSSTRIKIEDLLTPDADERLVCVIGAGEADNETTLRSVEGDDNDHEVFRVSRVQLGLLMVYERLLEVEVEGELDCSWRKCRLLAARGQIGPLIGKEGSNIAEIRGQSGAHVRVLTADQPPPCADHSDNLVQLSGDSISVRKALILVSKCLQDNYKEKQTVIPAHVSNGSTSFVGNVSGSVSVEIAFRMLCTSSIVGLLIGKGGSTVNAVEAETGAKVHFAAQIPGCHERAITVSAMEQVEAQHSPAQNGVVRLFAKAIEAHIQTGLVPMWNNNGATARLLIAPYQAGCLIGVGGDVISDLIRMTNTKIQILDGHQVPHCASFDDRVVQIIGDYFNVRNALVEVTQRLRTRIFSSKGVIMEQATSYPYSVPDGTNTIVYNMENLDLNQGEDILSKEDNASSEDSAKKTVTIGVPEDIFKFVFDENGTRLAQLIEISGAVIVLQNPSDSKEGKVFISGTPTQTLAAQSLLRAYTVSAK